MEFDNGEPYVHLNWRTFLGFFISKHYHGWVTKPFHVNFAILKVNFGHTKINFAHMNLNFALKKINFANVRADFRPEELFRSSGKRAQFTCCQP